MAAWLFIRRYWKVAAMLILLLLAYIRGADDANARWEYITAKEAARHAIELQRAEAKARDQEQKWAAAFDVSAQIQHQELANVQKHRDRLLADLRSGRLRLQACPAARLPEAPADSGQSPESSDSGQPAMAGELVNRLAVCDEVTLERNQAVELLRAERR